MKIYENVYIGTFIYKLGFLSAKSNKYDETSINLFQQTPVDPILGDLLSSKNGNYIIIEFKTNKKDKKETNKAEILKKKISNKNNLLKISERCHYIGVGEIIDKEEAKLDIHGYYEYMINYKRDSNENFIDFINNYISDNNLVGVKKKDFIEYTNFLKQIYKTKRKYSTSALIIEEVVDGDGDGGSNSFKLIPTDNFEALITGSYKKTMNFNLNPLRFLLKKPFDLVVFICIKLPMIALESISTLFDSIFKKKL